eukprot:TRINITY_DN2490_c0_g1_i7.p1 TRINITY_DN2490_c0_g1~~TRINITY_DN2490_c0_g1_i7.p1  ORF type:complete len:229 (+),score=11.48 TRINITY_DN2490_c0_g1_i7:37-723(+)
MVLSECCCGCTLRTGCLIIGIMQAVWEVFCILVTFISMLNTASISSSFFPICKNGMNELCETSTFVLYNILGGSIAVHLIVLAFVASLIHGTVTKKACFLMAWIIWNWICCTFTGFLVIYPIICLFAILLIGPAIGLTLAAVMFFGVWIYFIRVVSSHRVAMMKEKSSEPGLTTTIPYEKQHDQQYPQSSYPLQPTTLPPVYVHGQVMPTADVQHQDVGKTNPGYGKQ